MRILLVLGAVILLSNCTQKNSLNEPLSTHSVQAISNKVIQDLLTRKEYMWYKTENVHAVHYAEACAAYGAVRFASFMEDQKSLQRLTRRYEKVITDSFPNTANHVDANVYGILPLEIYKQTKEDIFFKQGIKLADGQWQDTLQNGLSAQTRFWIDDVYMINALQVQAYRVTGDTTYLNRAALETTAYLEKLQQPNGLFYHGENAPFYWGRGNGWVAAGLAELLLELPESHPQYKTIVTGYRKMMKSLLEYQSDDGMWHQLIDKRNSFKETSSTAMFGFAFTVGVKKGLLPIDTYQKAYMKTWNKLSMYITEGGKVREVCVGTGQSQDVNYYLERPRIVGDLHGQAPLLWFAYGLLVNQ